MEASPSKPSDSVSKPKTEKTAVKHIIGWRRLLAWPLAVMVRLWGRSLRFETDPESLAIYQKTDTPIALILWHNRLFLAGEIVRRYRKGRPAYALVSASKDGAWLEAFFSMVGIQTVRGSSSKLGREAASGLIDMLKAGHDIGITPDGPRGPCYDFKAGALIVTRRAQATVLVIGGEFDSCWRLKSWDRFVIPKPFSRVRLRAYLLPHSSLPADRDEASAIVLEKLKSINRD